jgi:hypothetical protein
MAKRKKKRVLKRPQGRPRINLTESQIHQVIAGIARGLNIHDMAALLGIGHATLERRVAEDRQWAGKKKKGKSNLFEAIEKGRAAIKTRLFRKAVDMALDEKHPSAQVLVFLLKARYGMKETTVIAGDKDNPIGVAPTKEQIESAIVALASETSQKGVTFE